MSPNGDDGGGRVPRRRLLGLGALALLAVLAGCGGAEPAPSVCYGCSDDGAARALPPNASTGESVAHLHLAPETGGAPRVVARTRVGLETAEELQRNASRREAVQETVLAVRAGDRSGPGGRATTPTPRYEGTDGRPVYPVPAFEARDLSVGTEADALVVSFRVAGIPGLEPAETPPLVREGIGGAVQVDRFDVRDGRNPHPENAGHPYQLGIDRLVVHAPPGTRPVVAPEGATVRGDAVVLRSLPADSTLVFAPDGASGTLAAHATLTADTLGWVVPDSFWVALLPTIQFGLLLGGLRAGKRGGTRYAVGGLLLALLLTLGPLAIVLGPLGLVAVGLVVVVASYLLWRAGRDDGGAEDDQGDGADAGSDAAGGWLPDLRAGVEPWLVPGVTVAAGAAVLTVAASVLAGDSPLPPLLFLVGGALPLAGTIGLGRLEHLDGPDPRRRWLVLSVLVTPWLFAVGHVAGREVPDSVETLVLVVVWGTGATLVGFIAHRVAARFSSPEMA
ncbi:hypothetical protein [Haloglomus litoreum]|uniref:hypothetical protein n=1 Tax=Haloglomus litoreum TaxID=3034026 RepID=UPI0023E762DB|nr:hypothetical protein [Haloglomus sp. DT116]